MFFKCGNSLPVLFNSHLPLAFCIVSFIQKWKIMSCKMKIEQLKEAIGCGNEEVKSGELYGLDSHSNQ
jgi:hypothetical protein